jgi:anti-anti-sigma factor
MNSQRLTIEPLHGTSTDRHIYRLNGPLVLATMFAVQDILRSDCASTILDLTEVPYMDSAGLGVLTNAYISLQKHGRRFMLVGVNDRVQALLKVTRLESLFEVFASVEGAIEALGRQAHSGAA